MENQSALNTIFAQLDDLLPAKVKATLHPPASPAQLETLAARFGGALPDDVLALLRWHDGQSWNARLNPDDNRRLLSIAEILETCDFFADPQSEFMQPWRATWLPVLSNDSGDYLVYETEGEARGALLHYWHDDASRSKANASLLQWARELLEAYEDE